MSTRSAVLDATTAYGDAAPAGSLLAMTANAASRVSGGAVPVSPLRRRSFRLLLVVGKWLSSAIRLALGAAASP